LAIQKPEHLLHTVASDHESHHEPEHHVDFLAPLPKYRLHGYLLPKAESFCPVAGVGSPLGKGNSRTGTAGLSLCDRGSSVKALLTATDSLCGRSPHVRLGL